jgi:hyperosmotically inducible protein
MEVAHLSGTFASQGDEDCHSLRFKNIKGVRDVMDMASVEAADPVVERFCIDQKFNKK